RSIVALSFGSLLVLECRVERGPACTPATRTTRVLNTPTPSPLAGTHAWNPSLFDVRAAGRVAVYYPRRSGGKSPAALREGKGIPMSEPEEPGSAGSQPPAAQNETDPDATRVDQQPPQTVESSPTPATTASAGWQGPIGKPRGAAFVILISIITLGIYHLYWSYKVFEEMKEHTGAGVGGVLALVIAIVVNPVIWFLAPSEIGKMYRGDGRTAPMTGWTGLWILLPIVGWFGSSRSRAP